MGLSPQQKLAAARLKARQKAPYFGAVLLGLVPHEAPGLGTIGVTESMILLIDWEFVDQLTVDQFAAILTHEVHHVLRDHSGRRKRRGIPDDETKIWGIATDCEINDDLEKTWPQLFDPKWKFCGVLPKNYKMGDGLTGEQYYDLLKKNAIKISFPMPCGSCSGNPLPGEPKGAEHTDKLGNKKDVEDAGGRSSIEVERLKRQVAAEIKEHAKRPGSVPAGLERWADEMLSPPKIRWQDKLRRVCRHAVAWKAGMVDLTHSKTSRRQWGIGYGPGRPMLPAYRAPVPNVAFVTDTSGSMSEHELGECLREAHGVLAATGAKLTFCACDAEVHSLKTVASVQDMVKLLKGGGGTNFIPAFDALEKATPRPNIVIFATDGCGTAPSKAPSWCKVIWLLVGSYRQAPCKWGEVVEIDDVKEKAA